MNTSMDLEESIEKEHFDIINALMDRDANAAIDIIKGHLIRFYNIEDYINNTKLFIDF